MLAGDKFTPEIYLKQTSEFVNHLLKTKKEFKNLKYQEIDITFDKACFQHGMAYGDFKDLVRRTASDKFLRDKSFNIVNILNMMDIKEWCH